ncbi:uncharacterized protein LOC129599039 [Paramacrobiotus metropolitanus]|uniref:uncharacterized protein LOC129599039 n=1 Tax=Paramacrobiotus metropolitanus TaxID=2943436 RepID=UPI002445FB5A|nr:uncharacterized protein LOC129599039 [Paramacrobiotus metropolitanus]
MAPVVQPGRFLLENMGCGYCGLEELRCLAYCGAADCRKFFCNVSKNGQLKSHIIQHSERTGHNVIVVSRGLRDWPMEKDERAKFILQNFTFSPECFQCHDSDIFHLGTEWAGGHPFRAEQIWCRAHATARGTVTSAMWQPLVETRKVRREVFDSHLLHGLVACVPVKAMNLHWPANLWKVKKPEQAMDRLERYWRAKPAYTHREFKLWKNAQMPDVSTPADEPVDVLDEGPSGNHPAADDESPEKSGENSDSEVFNDDSEGSAPLVFSPGSSSSPGLSTESSSSSSPGPLERNVRESPVDHSPVPLTQRRVGSEAPAPGAAGEPSVRENTEASAHSGATDGLEAIRDSPGDGATDGLPAIGDSPGDGAADGLAAIGDSPGDGAPLPAPLTPVQQEPVPAPVTPVQQEPGPAPVTPVQQKPVPVKPVKQKPVPVKPAQQKPVPVKPVQQKPAPVPQKPAQRKPIPVLKKPVKAPAPAPSPDESPSADTSSQSSAGESAGWVGDEFRFKGWRLGTAEVEDDEKKTLDSQFNRIRRAKTGKERVTAIITRAAIQLTIGRTEKVTHPVVNVQLKPVWRHQADKRVFGYVGGAKGRERQFFVFEANDGDTADEVAEAINHLFRLVKATPSPKVGKRRLPRAAQNTTRSPAGAPPVLSPAEAGKHPHMPDPDLPLPGPVKGIRNQAEKWTPRTHKTNIDSLPKRKAGQEDSTFWFAVVLAQRQLKLTFVEIAKLIGFDAQQVRHWSGLMEAGLTLRQWLIRHPGRGGGKAQPLNASIVV